jgi:nucleotide-binding universal stress UspA family protein
MNINKILVPVDFAEASVHAGKQAAALARHFHSEVVLLHVVAPPNYTAGALDGGYVVAMQDLMVDAVERAGKELDAFLAPELEGLPVRRLLLEGDAARGIVETAHAEQAKLIVMPTHGYGPFRRFIMGSVTAKVLHDSDVPVLTGAHLQDPQDGAFAIRNVLCAVDLSPHSRNTVCWAGQMAAEFDAKLTLAHITPGVEIYGPGGVYAAPEWREALISSTAEQMAKLQEQMGSHAETFIECGDVPRLLRTAAEQTKADLLVVGRAPSGARLRTNGYAIIREAGVPVLSV